MPRYAFPIGFPITINRPEIPNSVLVESLETINKTMQFLFPSPVKMVKSDEKILQLSLPLRCGKMLQKCGFEEMDSECSAGKNDGF